MTDDISNNELRDEVRTRKDIIKRLVDKLEEGLEATEVKTCSYQGNMTWEAFTDFPTRLSYIKAIIDIGELSETNFAASEGASGSAIERIKQLLARSIERSAESPESSRTS